MSGFIADTPEPPYYAVIFPNVKSEETQDYEAMADKMVQLASQQAGYLGIESVSDAQGNAITISYWESEEAILAWKKNTAHQQAQDTGKAVWYKDYRVRVAKVERAYGMKS